MSATLKRFLLYSGLFSAANLAQAPVRLYAQVPESNNLDFALLKHSKEQFEQAHYVLAARSAREFLAQPIQPTNSRDSQLLTLALQQAKYIKAVSNLKANLDGSVAGAQDYIAHAINPVYRQRTAFALAQHYFAEDNLPAAIEQYELAGIENLSNSEIADAKFELAYSYFNDRRFDKAKPLFASIKDLPDNKYYIAGNYYYGLLAYNDKDYAQALASFKRIHNEEEYKDIVPYYEAEINYFSGDYDAVLALSNRYLRKNDKPYYDKEMHLLTGQTYFERKQFKEALPYFEYYYNNSERVRKEELYELAYTYYRLDKWKDAIDKFKPLSNTNDSLGQTSMYLLGDCYLETGDKKGARNAFGMCADMDFNPSQKEAAAFLYAKLSYESGNESVATRKLYDFVKQYPHSANTPEAQKLLGSLLARSSNYSEAFAIMGDMPVKDNQTWAIYQQVGLGRALQLMQSNKYHEADSVLSLSLQQPASADYEAIAYFWKGDIAYREQRYAQAIQHSNTFLEKVKGREATARRISPQATVANANYTIGYASMETDKYSEAGKAFASAQQDAGTNESIDATVREADAYFMQKDFDKAGRLYDKAMAANTPESDYARYQKSLVLGLQGKNDEKINQLNTIVNKVPASPLRDEARYELAVSYLEADRNNEAIQLLESVSNNSNVPEALRAKAMSKLAYAYRETGNDGQAIKTLRNYLTQYPTANDRTAAADALRNLYIDQGDPDKYAEFLKENNMPAESEAGMEQTYYAAAETEYGNGNWNKSVALFGKYLDKYPNGSNAVKARYYRAESYFNQKETAKALVDYKAVADGHWNDFTDDAAARAAQIAMQQKDYATAQQYYGILRNTVTDNASLQNAYKGLMQANAATNQNTAAAAYADTLLAMPEVAAGTKAEAQLIKARSLQQNSDLETAKNMYAVLDKQNIGATSAEARYRIAEILLQQNKLKEAEEQASYAAQASGGSDYWVVKSYILIADILTQQKDYFNAKATLQSIISNNDNKEIKEEAAKKLAEVKKLEKSSSKLNEE
ncbi:MAG: tetratricopeptide repeat protein [Edaphocola sp.]